MSGSAKEITHPVQTFRRERYGSVPFIMRPLRLAKFMVARSAILIFGLAVCVSACGSSGKKGSTGGDAGASGIDAAVEIPAECKVIGEAPELLPNVEGHHRTLEFWLNHLAKTHDMDEVLMTPDQVQNMNRALQVPREKYHGQNDFLAPVDYPKLKQSVEDRRAAGQVPRACLHQCAGPVVQEAGIGRTEECSDHRVLFVARARDRHAGGRRSRRPLFG